MTQIRWIRASGWYAIEEAIGGAKGWRHLFLVTHRFAGAYNERPDSSAYYANILAYSSACIKGCLDVNLAVPARGIAAGISGPGPQESAAEAAGRCGMPHSLPLFLGHGPARGGPIRFTKGSGVQNPSS